MPVAAMVAQLQALLEDLETTQVILLPLWLTLAVAVLWNSGLPTIQPMEAALPKHIPFLLSSGMFQQLVLSSLLLQHLHQMVFFDESGQATTPGMHSTCTCPAYLW